LNAGLLVSVVMPSFNQAEFIELAVRSVLEQDYQPLELVVADGGSTDGTVQRLEALSHEFGTRLRWVSEKDCGPAHAINKALRLAKGQVIGWLNSDDLYAADAVGAAVRYLAARPDAVMVYGEGEHIDADGKWLGRYPTRPPSATIDAFQEGCFICQPTVFLRRQIFDEVGYLDESLVTAFDFELWLRVFRRFPDRIACLGRVQAFSRLHEDCITSRLRQLVAVEGVKVLGKHLGHARVEWLLSYLEELCSRYPADNVSDLRSHMLDLIGQLKQNFLSDALESLVATLASDARLNIGPPDTFVSVTADGWASKVLTLHMREVSRYCSMVKLQCSHLRPVFAPLSLAIKTSWGTESSICIKTLGPFEIVLPLPAAAVGRNAVVSIVAESVFVPNAIDPRSTDARQLSFKVDKLYLE
jgi:glycosyltransferase involved in cell wall biosynthesis